MAQAMTVAEETALSRVLVTDEAGRVLYDNRETGGAVGDYALYLSLIHIFPAFDP